MKERLTSLKILLYVIFALEMIGIVFFGICYFQNYFNVRDFITERGLFISLSSIILTDFIILFFVIFYVETRRKNSDLRVAELIGKDIQEAYNFGMIGLVVTDENNVVLWTNDLFKQRQIDILDTNILSWNESLVELQEGGADLTIKTEINSRTYSVKLLKDAGLYIFKDITELETTATFSKNQSTVIGQIVIDNYSDITDGSEDVDETMQEVRNAIASYCKEHFVLLRKLRNDAYFVVCNYESLEKMQQDKFSLLDRIRGIGEKRSSPPTISVGLAFGFPDVVKLNEMAANAIEIAMSRGGDQAVVSQYGEEIAFYGGKSVAQENRNKVRIRVVADSILSLIKLSSNVIIMGHSMMDMDALGACLGVKTMCDYCKKDAVIVYEPKLVERKTKSTVTIAFDKHDSSFFVSENQAAKELRSNTLVIVCDVHRASMTIAPKIVEKASKVMIIDHHRRGEDIIESPIFAAIDPSASSASEMVAEIIYYSSANPRIMIPEHIATIMLSGIFLDSNFFKNTTSNSKTFEASMILKEFGANNSVADDYLKDEFEEHALINKIISTLKTPQYGIVYCVAPDDDIIEAATLAKVANECMQMKGVNACFVIGRTATDEIKISCRSDETVNVQLIAEKLNGGGHFSQAAGILKKTTTSQAEYKLLDILDESLVDARKSMGAK